MLAQMMHFGGQTAWNDKGRSVQETLHGKPGEAGSRTAALQTVLFDIGNVIASDYWESLWLKKGTGLADVLGVPVKTASSIGKELWQKFSLWEAEEEYYWSEFETLLGIKIPKSHVEEAERINISANPQVRLTMTSLSAAGIAVGLISNNTSFWAPKQLALAGVDKKVDQRLSFLSCAFRADKTKSSPDLFSIASAEVDASRALVIDDRIGNVVQARETGFAAALYGDGVNKDADGYYIQNDFASIDIIDLIRHASC